MTIYRALCVGLWVALSCATSAVAAEEPGCTLYTQDTFPPGMVWWRVDQDRARETGLKGFPEGRAAYLVTGVRPDGVLIQNREARYPRLISWKLMGRSQVSLDGRKTWRSGCADE